MTGRLSLRIPCDGSAVAGLIETVEAFLKASLPSPDMLPPDLLPSVAVTLDEVVTNIASYAHPEGGDHFIDVDLEIVPGELRIAVSDDGMAFDPTQAAAVDTCLGIDERAVGGLGILLVMGLMDRVSYERTAGHNRLHLTKIIPGG